jgi:predicted GNAT family acetyltransferase
MPDAPSVQHDPGAHRFIIATDGNEAFLAYRQEGSTLDMYHTFVPEAFRGRGLAEQLCRAGFEYAKARQLTVIPSCPYVSGAYLKRHPEYLSLTQSAS